MRMQTRSEQLSRLDVVETATKIMVISAASWHPMSIQDGSQQRTFW